MATELPANSSVNQWPPVPMGSPARWLAVGIHLGLGLVCFSAAYTRQPADFTAMQWGGVVAVAVLLIVLAAATRGRIALRQSGRLLLAVGAGLAMSLSFEPQLADLPGLQDNIGGPWTQLYPSIATVGVGVAFVFWLLFYVADGERGLHPIPFRHSLILTFALLVGLAVLMYITLSPVYGLDGGETTRVIIFNVIQYAALLVAVLGSCGGPGVRGWPFYYIGLALLVAMYRTLIWMGGLSP